MIEQFKHHPSFSQAVEIQQICDPLSILDITTFSHLRVFQNYQLTVQCNRPEFLLNYLNKKYYAADPCVNIYPEITDLGEYLLWDSVNCTGQIAKMLADSSAFNFKHVFTIIKKQSTFTDFYHFGTHLSNPAIHQIYINNLDVLDRFISFFNAQVKQSKVLSRAYSIILNDRKKCSHHKPINLSPNLIVNSQGKRQILLEKMQLAEWKFLKPNEIKCARLVLKGKTAKEIAKDLNISYRTVEDRIEVLKMKLNAKNKSDLIVKLIGNKAR